MKQILFFLVISLLSQGLKSGSKLQSTAFLEAVDWDEVLLQGTRILPGQNPLGRDEDDLPKTADEKGSEAASGDTDYLLVTSFKSQVPGSGQIWTIPKHKDESFVLIAGLQTPTGLCFDKNHDFLYVCDPGQGKIFQFEIEKQKSKKFILASDQVATIYQGLAPTHCSVDAYGNLYFVDLLDESIGFVDYLDLWAGLVNINRTLYRNIPQLSLPSDIAVDGSKTIYFVNSLNPQDAGVINSAPAAVKALNAEPVTSRLRTI